jgi:hypothetical protein
LAGSQVELCVTCCGVHVPDYAAVTWFNQPWMGYKGLILSFCLFDRAWPAASWRLWITLSSGVVPGYPVRHLIKSRLCFFANQQLSQPEKTHVRTCYLPMMNRYETFLLSRLESGHVAHNSDCRFTRRLLRIR